MTQSELNVLHEKVNTVRDALKDLDVEFSKYQSKSIQAGIMNETIDALVTLARYLHMVTAQFEGWVPKHPEDTLKSKLDWIQSKSKTIPKQTPEGKNTPVIAAVFKCDTCSKNPDKARGKSVMCGDFLCYLSEEKPRFCGKKVN